MGSDQSGYAIVDGQVVRIGKSIDGFRLLSVDRSSALFESGSDRVRLNLSVNIASGT